MFNSLAMSQSGLGFEAQFISLSTGTLVIFQDPNPVHLYMIILQKFVYTSNINLFLRFDFHLRFSSLESHFSSPGSISPVIAGKSHLLLRSQCFKHSWVSVVTARLPTVRIRNRPNLSVCRKIYVQTHSL